TGDDVQSYSEYDGSDQQKLLYTFQMTGAAKFIAGFANTYSESLNGSAGVISSTIFDYAGGQYLKHSVSLKGKHTTATTGDDVQSYSEYDGSDQQKLLYTFQMTGATKFIAGFANTYSESLNGSAGV